MKATRIAVIFWLGVIVVLLLVELAEITHLFTLPISSAIGDPLAFVFALVFTTILALVGALFIGIYISQRLSSTLGFTPFEEEMLRMRSDVKQMRSELAEIKGRFLPSQVDPPNDPVTAREEDRPS